jgi:hypothetical protein
MLVLVESVVLFLGFVLLCCAFCAVCLFSMCDVVQLLALDLCASYRSQDNEARTSHSYTKGNRKSATPGVKILLLDARELSQS